jgi:ABC-type antimicrobial peptide transport system permease subunit
MAQMFWPAGDPIGARVVRSGVAREIIGIVGGVKHFGLDRDVTPEMYTPHAQQPSFHTMTLVIRAAVPDPMSLTQAVRYELAALDRDVPLSSIRTLEDVVNESTTEPRFRMVLVSTFAALAVVLSVIGVAGVIAYLVGKRTREIGVRVALGATRSQVLSLLIRQGMSPAAIGLALGFAGALGATRVLAGLLFGVASTDLSVFGAATLTLGCAALAATLVPARRATRIDPMIALRAE